MKDEPALLNVNGSFGAHVAETADYPRVDDMLRDMDRLGVAQAVAWNRAAVPNAPAGNARLLAALEGCPAARGRVFPVFVVAPTMAYQRGAMADVERALRSHAVRALRALPKTLYYNLRQLEVVLEPLAGFQPVVLVSINEVSDAGDILFLAGRFPHMPLIITDAMWHHLNAVCDCMRRRPNVMAETSWIHVQGAVKLLARAFGANRLCFGLGPRAQAGAAIAGLVHSGLAPDDIAAVSRGNAAAWLGLTDGPKGPAASAHGKAPDSLWGRHLRGERLGVPVIDAHAHLGGSSRWLLDEGDLPALLAQMLARMDRVGVEQTIVFLGSDPLADDPLAGNEVIERITRPHHDRIKGLVYFHPSCADALAARLDEFFARDFFVGFKILCSYWRRPLADPVFLPAWEYADRHRLPVLLHTWGQDTDVAHNAAAYDTPANLAPIAARYPHAVFIVGHSGGNDPGRAEAEALALEHDNVFLEWSGSFCSRVPWEDTIRRVGSRRVVFGTDSVYHSMDWELGRLLSLDVADAELEPILGATMRGILNRRV